MVSTNGAKAGMLCTIRELDWPFDHYDKVLKRVRAMSIDELNQVAKKYFTTQNMTSIRVGRV